MRIVSGSDDGWDASKGVELNVLKGYTNVVRSVAFSTDGMRIVSGSDDGWDASKGVCHQRHKRLNYLISSLSLAMVLALLTFNSP